MSTARSSRERVLVLVPLAFSAAVYYPLIDNYFLADDFLHLYHARNGPLLEFLVRPNGGHVLLSANAVFYACLTAFGTRTPLWFAGVLATHLLNVALLFGVVRSLTGSARLAVFGATLWGTSLLNEVALGWYSAYEHVLSATALLLILWPAARLSDEERLPSPGVQLLWCALALAGATSFGVGIPIGMGLPVILTLLWSNAKRAPRLPYVLLLAIPVTYLGLLRSFAALSGTQVVATGGFVREYVLPRWESILPLFVKLISYGATRLLLGFFYVPDGFPARLSAVTLAAVTGLTLVALVRSPGVMRRRTLACALLVGCAYVAVAVGRVALLAVMPLDSIAVVSHYHYSGLIGLSLLVCVALRSTGWRLPSPSWASVALGLWLTGSLAAFLLERPALDHHDEVRAETRRVLGSIRSRIHAQPPGTVVYITNRGFAPVPPVVIRLTSFPGWAAVFSIFYDDNTVEGRQVRFVERDPAVIEATRGGKRTAGLLVPPPKARPEHAEQSR